METIEGTSIGTTPRQRFNNGSAIVEQPTPDQTAANSPFGVFRIARFGKVGLVRCSRHRDTVAVGRTLLVRRTGYGSTSESVRHACVQCWERAKEPTRSTASAS